MPKKSNDGYTEKLGQITEYMRKRKEKSPYEEEVETRKIIPKKDTLKDLIRGLRKRNLINNNFFTNERIPECIEISMKLTVGTDSIVDTRQSLYDLYIPWRRLQGIRRKLPRFQLKLPEKFYKLNDIGYYLGMFYFKRKHPDEYAGLQWAIARGNEKQIREEWDKIYKNTLYADTYKEFIQPVKLYHTFILTKIGIPLRKAYEITRLLNGINQSI